MRHIILIKIDTSDLENSKIIIQGGGLAKLTLYETEKIVSVMERAIKRYARKWERKRNENVL